MVTFASAVARIIPVGFWGGLGAVVCSVLAVSALASQRTAPAQQNEPPLQFLLQVAGKSVPVLLDRPFEVEIAGKKTKMTLTVKPYRVLDVGGVRFRYQRHYTFEVTPGDSPQWTLSGNDNTIILGKIDEQVDLAKMVDEVIESYSSSLKEAISNPSDVSIRLHDRSIRGKRFILRLAGLTQRQEVFAFSHRGASYLLLFQDGMRDDGLPADECVRARKMLEKSFEFGD